MKQHFQYQSLHSSLFVQLINQHCSLSFLKCSRCFMNKRKSEECKINVLYVICCYTIYMHYYRNETVTHFQFCLSIVNVLEGTSAHIAGPIHYGPTIHNPRHSRHDIRPHVCFTAQAQLHPFGPFIQSLTDFRLSRRVSESYKCAPL